jgi:hypothetical protein
VWGDYERGAGACDFKDASNWPQKRGQRVKDDISFWGVALLTAAIGALGGFLLSGRYEAVSGGSHTIYIFNRYNGEVRFCKPNDCKTLTTKG